MARGSRLGLRLPPPATPIALALLLVWAFGESALPPEGPLLLEVESPSPGDVAGPEGIEVLVRFAPHGRVAIETFQATLNGAEVTDELTMAENGAWGRLHTLLDGENVLRVAVFGRAWGSHGRFFEQAREVRFRRWRPLDLNRG